jgi:hypothetical protein
MRRRISLLVFLLMAPTALAMAQNVAALLVPAARILRYRTDLRLDSAQAGRLRDLTREQNEVLGRATSAFLHAEAELVDATRSSDMGIRRAAMEKRSRAAVDGELARLRAEKDARALLTNRQVTMLDILLTETVDDPRTHPIWESQVAPLPLNAMPFAAPDSGDVRIAVSPLTAEIYVDDRLIGFGRVAIRLPVGNHGLKFRTPSCTDTRALLIAKGPPSVLTQQMSCGK